MPAMDLTDDELSRDKLNIITNQQEVSTDNSAGYSELIVPNTLLINMGIKTFDSVDSSKLEINEGEHKLNRCENSSSENNTKEDLLANKSAVVINKNGLDAHQKAFLSFCEEKFKDRFTENDVEYMRTYNSKLVNPPIVCPYSTTRGRYSDRTGGRNYQNDYRQRDYRNKYKDSRDRYRDNRYHAYGTNSRNDRYSSGGSRYYKRQYENTGRITYGQDQNDRENGK